MGLLDQTQKDKKKCEPLVSGLLQAQLAQLADRLPRRGDRLHQGPRQGAACPVRGRLTGKTPELVNSGKASRKRKAEDTVLTASEAGEQKED